MTREYTKGILPDNEKGYFERVNKGFTCTGETLKETVDDQGLERSTTYVVMKGRFTAYGMCRDCGDHYIIARWSRYDRIDKETYKVTYDVNDF